MEQFQRGPADGGYYPNNYEVMIGATVDGSYETGLGNYANEVNIKTYLDKIHLIGRTDMNSSGIPGETENLIKQQQDNIWS